MRSRHLLVDHSVPGPEDGYGDPGEEPHEPGLQLSWHFRAGVDRYSSRKPPHVRLVGQAFGGFPDGHPM